MQEEEEAGDVTAADIGRLGVVDDCAHLRRTDENLTARQIKRRDWENERGWVARRFDDMRERNERLLRENSRKDNWLLVAGIVMVIAFAWMVS